MTDITDATVVDFCNQVLRPLADALTGLKPYLEVEQTRWDDHIKPLLNGHIGSDPLIDGAGPSGDGRVALTKNDLTKFMNQIGHLSTLMGGQNVTQTATGEAAFEDIMKPHVKPRFPS
jgi:hypothetical protein